MMIFIKGFKNKAIPQSRVYRMTQENNTITIVSEDSMKYNTGDATEVDVIHYKDELTAQKAFYNYYIACTKNQGAFYFGEDIGV